jgi:hypothetical protein
MFFFRWLNGVRKEFKTLMTGSLLLVAMGLAQGVWQVPIPRWCYVAVTACFLTWAFFRTWLKEHVALEDAQNTIAVREEELRSLRNPFAGAKWENFLAKLEMLDAPEKYLLYQFVLQGCHMLQADGVEIVKRKFYFAADLLSSIQQKTGFITSGFNGYQANPGIAPLLEQWAKTYEEGQ